jgi:hypothetical protein
MKLSPKGKRERGGECWAGNVGRGDLQGDQIGRSFAHRLIVYIPTYFIQFFENQRSCPHFWATISIMHYAIILTLNALGCVLGDSIKTAPGHSGDFAKK